MPPKRTPSPPTDRSDRAANELRHSRNTTQLITFVDSQDQNSRSIIQRHTAHHSNAQRRDARLRSLSSNRPRVLEWQRRSSTEVESLFVTSPPSSTNSASASPAPALALNVATSSAAAPQQGRSAQIGDPVQAQTLSLSGGEGPRISADLMESCKSTLLAERPIDKPILISELIADCTIRPDLQLSCQHASRALLVEIFRYVDGLSATSRTLLLANVLLSRGSRAHAFVGVDLNDAHRYNGQGTRLLRERLTDPETATSDDSIQAVLLLVAYASDMTYPDEARIHLGALARMIRQRGGLETMERECDSVLLVQLRALPRSRHFHLTIDCTDDCACELRFPDA